MGGELKLRQYLKERFGNYDDSIGAEDSLEGVVDSIGIFELVEFVENEFGISIPNEEFSPQRFSSIADILATIEECRS